MNYLIIVPAYNEAKVIGQTIANIQEKTKKLSSVELIVIDDGSYDLTRQEAQKTGVVVIRHLLNRGLGGAIGTGLEYARRGGFDCAVTIDADGQHNPEDILKLIEPIQKDQADVVIGTRYHPQNQAMPMDRKFLLSMSNLLTHLLFGKTTSDSLSGFRAFNKKAIQQIVIKTERMEVSNELFAEIKRLNLKVDERPIEVIYTDYSKGKGQKNSNAIHIVYKLILRLFR